MQTPSERLRTPHERAARATRILDATAELLLRHGYRRVTIDDVATRTGIGKGTVYLHWKTRDELFAAVFEREVIAAIDELLAELRQDATACLPHRLARAYFLAIMRRPLLRGLFLADAELLGKLARPGSGARDSRHGLMSRTYFELLARHGLLRTDLSPEALSYAFQATFEGFLSLTAETDAGASAPAELIQRADLLARTIQRAFESQRTPSQVTQQAIASQVIHLLARLIEADRADLGSQDS